MNLTVRYQRLFTAFIAITALALAGALSACTSSLSPLMSYQGRLTSATGVPLNGNHNFVFRLFPAATGNTPIYTDTKVINVTNGLFDTSIGPASILAGVRSEQLSQPLWLEVTINGETLAPRQRLMGSPYAFTLMPGAVISSTFTTGVAGTVVNGVVTIINAAPAGTGVNEPLTTLRIEGIGGLELVEVPGSGATNDAKIYSEKTNAGSDITLISNDLFVVDLDEDDNNNSYFRIRSGTNAVACTITELGNLTCSGTKSAVVSVGEEQRKLYAIESPEVWFEDFGRGELKDGAVAIVIDPAFATTVNLGDYHVFLTPLGDCKGLYVASKTPVGFEVRELSGGASGIAFDYRIVAKRLGYEGERLALADEASINEEDNR